MVGAEAIVNQHIFKVIPQSNLPSWFVHGRLLALLPHFADIGAGKATTMGHIKRHHLDELFQLPIIARMRELDSVRAPRPVRLR
jgi:type I restriction enzyme S subunit